MAKVVICLDGSQYAEDAYNCEYDKYCVAKCLMKHADVVREVTRIIY